MTHAHMEEGENTSYMANLTERITTSSGPVTTGSLECFAAPMEKRPSRRKGYRCHTKGQRSGLTGTSPEILGSGHGDRPTGNESCRIQLSVDLLSTGGIAETRSLACGVLEIENALHEIDCSTDDPGMSLGVMWRNLHTAVEGEKSSAVYYTLDILEGGKDSKMRAFMFTTVTLPPGHKGYACTAKEDAAPFRFPWRKNFPRIAVAAGRLGPEMGNHGGWRKRLVVCCWDKGSYTTSYGTLPEAQWSKGSRTIMTQHSLIGYCKKHKYGASCGSDGLLHIALREFNFEVSQKVRLVMVIQGWHITARNATDKS
ncbi:hypothetical protein DL93DRAFT_2097947 [Clavulina sp. PMI_390]|nr:hypothetical protein DL93DRAFT_2097947 [Clavulina sp. PMI_390]